MRFTKMHGLGNDYVYVNLFEERVDDPARVARQAANRHFGIGGDGLILVGPPEPGVDADVRMRMFNADGSEAQMCGNGVRCVCKLAHDHGISRARPMRVQTGAGVLTLDYTLDDRGDVDQITVDMGEPILEAARIPSAIRGVSPDTRVIDHPIDRLVQWPPALAADWIDTCGFDPKMTLVSMGNPHAVMYCEHVDRVELHHVGPALEEHAMFPERINAHFVQVEGPGEVRMRTWERGSGVTLACGTGAAAVCVAGVLAGRTGRRILAHLPGGDLSLRWDEPTNHVFMTGPASEVFRGEWREAPCPDSVARQR